MWYSIALQCKLLWYVLILQYMFTSVGGYAMFHANTLGEHLDEWKAITNDTVASWLEYGLPVPFDSIPPFLSLAK